MENLIPTKTIKENGIVAIKNGIKPNSNKLIPIERKPTWLRIKSLNSPKYRELKTIVSEKKLHTVCEEAMCPNIQECWSHGTATFMLLGSVCTRACKFCAVDTGNPKGLLDKEEPLKVANSISHMDLKYAVLTSVNRDDLSDGGSEHFVKTIRAIKKRSPDTTIEILTPDFLRCEDNALEAIVAAKPDVFNHNMETVPSLYPSVRPGARYFHSLRLLQRVKEIDAKMFTKSGFMVGLGETNQEVTQMMDDMRSADIDFLTIGQYLQPTVKHHAVKRFVTPEEFKSLYTSAIGKGFLIVSSSPLTRSSYHAGDDFKRLQTARIAKLLA